MKPYHEYKDSGMEWIGKIPVDWDIKKLKYLIDGKLTYGANEAAEEINPENPRYIRISDFDNEGRLRDDTFKSLPFDLAKEYLLKEGDVLFARSGATVGKTFQFKNYNGIACFAGYLIKATPKSTKLDSDYLYFFTKSGIYENWKDSIFIQATIQNIGADKYSYLPITHPPVHLQRIISLFLNHKTRQIDDLIAKKQKLIELLKEERTSFIHNTVTKGLDLSVPMKDSGIEWMGKIPEHWECRKIGRSFRIIGSGTTPTSGREEYYQNGNIPWVLTGDLNDNYLFQTSKSITEKAFSEHSALKKFPAGSLIIALYGATIGRLSILELEATTNQACCVLADSKFYLIKFLFYWFLSNRDNIISLSYGGGQPNISQEIIRNIKVPCPSMEEQSIIVNYIDNRCIVIDNSLMHIEKEIELISEYKTSLINEAVTGKINVRV